LASSVRAGDPETWVRDSPTLSLDLLSSLNMTILLKISSLTSKSQLSNPQSSLARIGEGARSPSPKFRACFPLPCSRFPLPRDSRVHQISEHLLATGVKAGDALFQVLMSLERRLARPLLWLHAVLRPEVRGGGLLVVITTVLLLS
jgi:hypothetical protein